MTRTNPDPRWLAAITIRHGQPEYTTTPRGHLWQWHEGDSGVRIDQHDNSWVVFVFTYLRSVSLRTTAEPSATDIAQAATLAGLIGPGLASGSTRPAFSADQLVRGAS